MHLFLLTLSLFVRLTVSLLIGFYSARLGHRWGIPTWLSVTICLALCLTWNALAVYLTHAYL